MNIRIRLLSVCLLTASLLVGCARWDGTYYYDNAVFADFDPASLVENPVTPVTLTVEETTSRQPEMTDAPAQTGPTETPTRTRMTVLAEVGVYATPDLSSQQLLLLQPGEQLEMGPAIDGFREVYRDAAHLGYSPDGFAVTGDCSIYGELPVEHGTAPSGKNTSVPASSRLVDLSRYTDDVIIEMKLSQGGAAAGAPYYSRNLCMLRYGTVQKLLRAAARFAEDGYTLKILDAYRPTSVQQSWAALVQDTQWVANPALGIGDGHNRGCAVDITLLDKNGSEIALPTPVYTFTAASSRTAIMQAEARVNLDYLTDVMVSCGFRMNNAKWWHFEDTDIESYLPTDHPIDGIPLVAAER